MASVYLVVTVTVDRHQSARGGSASLLSAMMHRQKRFWQEDEVTITTPTVLALQPGCDSAGYPRIVSPSRRPVAPIALEETCRAFPFAVPNNQRIRVVGQHHPLSGPNAPAFPFLEPPVLVSDPPPPLGRVAAARP